MSKALDAIKKQSLEIQYETWEVFWGTVVECSDILKELDPNHRRLWLSELIQDLYREQKGKCGICGRKVEWGDHHVDHIIPFCYGGGNEPANLQIAHPHCNRSKRKEVDPWDLLRYLEGRYLNLRPSNSLVQNGIR
jgi:CRISPR/Cas system Type II protein with McrA/HNH and RuvC-like nuclease domain